MSRRDDLLAAVAKSGPAVARLMAVKKRSLKQAEALITDLASLNKQLAELATIPVVVIPAPSDPHTFAEALAAFTAAEDKILIERGLPHGHDGAERGAMNRDEHIALATSLGVLEALGGPDFFGPPPPPGALA